MNNGYRRKQPQKQQETICDWPLLTCILIKSQAICKFQRLQVWSKLSRLPMSVFRTFLILFRGGLRLLKLVEGPFLCANIFSLPTARYFITYIIAFQQFLLLQQFVHFKIVYSVTTITLLNCN